MKQARIIKRYMEGERMEYDNFVIYDGNKQITIYPLLEIERDLKKYIIYTYNTSDIGLDNLFIGEVTINNELIPIDDRQVNQFENILKETYNILQKKEL